MYEVGKFKDGCAVDVHPHMCLLHNVAVLCHATHCEQICGSGQYNNFLGFHSPELVNCFFDG